MFIWWNPVFHFPLSGNVTQEILQEVRQVHAMLRQNQRFLRAMAQATLEVADQTGADSKLPTSPGMTRLRELSAKFDLNQ